MKTIKSLLAVSVLVAAGAANAATIATGPDSVATELQPAPGFFLNQGSGTGSAVLDDSGTLTVNFSGTSTVLSTNVLHIDFSDVITGTIAGGVFTATGGHTHINSCSLVSGTDYCSQALSPAENTFTDITGTIAVANGALGTFVAHYASPGGSVKNTYNVGPLTLTPTVPVPAAAWLFGSGLLGLAGTARRRSKI